MIFALVIISLYFSFMHSFIYFFFLKNKSFSIDILFQNRFTPWSLSEPEWLLNLILIFLILISLLSIESPIMKIFLRPLVFSLLNFLIRILLVALLLNFREYCVLNYVASCFYKFGRFTVFLNAWCFLKDLVIIFLSEVCRFPF